MDAASLQRKEWLLLLVAAPWDSDLPGALDRVRVQKALFVVGKAGDVPGYYDFAPYHYGPFCREVYDDAEALVAAGQLEEVMHRGYKAYVPTPAGRAAAKGVLARVPDETSAYLKRVRDWVEGHSFNSLVRAIYERWPETRARSIFNG